MSNQSDQPAPGWYYAGGDPVGTQRYWNGEQWLGEPQWTEQAPVADGPQWADPNQGYIGAHPAQATVGYQPAPSSVVPKHLQANYGQRVGAWFVDHLVWIPAVAAIAIADDGIDVTTTTAEAIAIVMLIATFVIHIGNRLIYQGITGHSVGKKMVGIMNLKDSSQQPVGVGLLFARVLFGWLLSAVTCGLPFYALIDYLWPLWDDENQRLTDKVFGMHVVKAGQPAYQQAPVAPYSY